MYATRRAALLAFTCAAAFGLALGDTGGGAWEGLIVEDEPSTGDSGDTGTLAQTQLANAVGFESLSASEPGGAFASATSGEECGPWSWEILGSTTSSERSLRAAEIKQSHGLIVTDAWKIAWGADPLAATWWSLPDPIPRSLSLALPNGTCASWRLSATNDIVGERHVWIGRASDGNEGSIFLIDDENGLRFGWFSFNGVQGVAARVGEETWLMRGDWDPDIQDDVDADVANHPASDLAAFTEHHLPFVASPPPPSGGTEIDVLVSYTLERLSDSGVDGVLDDVAKGASWLNVSLLNTQVSASIRILAVENSGISDAGATSVVNLRSLWANNAGFSGLRARRDAVGADLHLLLSDLQLGGNDEGSAQKLDDLAGDDSKYRSVVRGVGEGDVFAHELGHLLGADHDVLNQGHHGGSFCFGVPPVQFCPNVAFINIVTVGGVVAPDPSWRTLMAYPGPCAGCRREPVFSSGRTSYNNVIPGSSLVVDNNSIINATIDDVAQYRSALITPLMFAPSTITGITRTTVGPNETVSIATLTPNYGPFKVSVRGGSTTGGNDLFTGTVCEGPHGIAADPCFPGISEIVQFTVPGGTPVFVELQTEPYLGSPIRAVNASSAIGFFGCDRDFNVAGTNGLGGADCDIRTGLVTAQPACSVGGGVLTCDLATGDHNLGTGRGAMALSSTDLDWDYVVSGVTKSGESFCCLYNDGNAPIADVYVLGSSQSDVISLDDGHMSLCGYSFDGHVEGRQGPDIITGSRCAVPGYGETLLGELGADHIHGQDGPDVIDAGGGNDVSFGEQGIDVLMDPGGTGDRLTGGLDGDFLCSKGTGTVMIGTDPSGGAEANVLFASAAGGPPAQSVVGGAGSSCGVPGWGNGWVGGGLACTLNSVIFCPGY